MPSGKNLDQMFMPTFSFGDVSRDEINTVLNIAGVSLAPPKKTPFATGIQRKKRVVLNTPVILKQQQQLKPVTRSPSPPPRIRQFETVYVEPEDEEETPLLSVPSPAAASVSTPVVPVVVAAPPPPVAEKKQPQQSVEEKREQPVSKPQQQKSATKKEAGKASTPSITAQQQAAAPASPSSSATSSAVTKTPVSPSTSSTTTVTIEPPSPQPKVKAPVTSWAALLKKNESAPAKPKSAAASAPSTNGSVPMTNGKPQGQQQKSKPNSPTPSGVPKFAGVADIISKYEPNYNSPLLQPRGLINNVNTCFMNVILQPLSHCAPFYNLVKTISNQTVQPMKSKTPLLDSIIEFINEFQSERLENLDPYGEPFVPEYVYTALRNQKKFDTLRGRQEDSEEFLCFLLDGLHEEMTTVLKEQQDKKDIEEAAAGGSDWLEVGAKNKTSHLRQNTFDESPISKIFMGKLRSVLHCPGAKDSINQEPYQSLPLDIQPDNVHTIEDAIANMTIPEIMHDYSSPKGVKVEATKQVFLEVLPPVLILHMKRFVFDNVGGVQKLSKRVNYGAKLTIQPEWLAQSVAGQPQPAVTYHLFGSVYHHGSSAGGGHYTCDIKRRSGEWLHIDDTTITSVSEQDVLVTEENTRTSEKLHAGQTAYILFYVRSS